MELPPELSFELTKNEIEYAGNIDEHWDLFHKAIDILEKRLKVKDFSDFTEEESEILTETFSKMRLW